MKFNKYLKDNRKYDPFLNLNCMGYLTPKVLYVQRVKTL